MPVPTVPAGVVVVGVDGAAVVFVPGASVVVGAPAKEVVVAPTFVVVVAPPVDVVVAPPAVVVVVPAVQTGSEIMLEPSVTAPLLARSRPLTVALVVALIEADARIVPANVEFVPSVAELPMCQNTLQGLALLINKMLLADAVVSVPPVWKMKTPAESP